MYQDVPGWTRVVLELATDGPGIEAREGDPVYQDVPGWTRVVLELATDGPGIERSGRGKIQVPCCRVQVCITRT